MSCAQTRQRSGVCRLLLACVMVILAGCASLTPHTPLKPTFAIKATGDTFLGATALASQPDPDLTGFRLLPSGDFSLHARLEMARLAQRSLDLQYYQVQDDQVGRTVLRSVRDAALRGVRVRLLIDDLYTSGEDQLLLALAATPNVELRLFNPFPAGRSSLAGRFAASLLDFGRVNHRMHNKLFIADGAVAVAGGRNLGDAYFSKSNGENFVDIDALVAGSLLPRLSSLFDGYWNSEYVRPLGEIVHSPLSAQDLRERFETLTNSETTPALPPPPPNDVLGYGPIGDDLVHGKLNLIWASAQAYADDPGRVVGREVEYGGVPLLDVDSVRYNVIEQIRRAKTEVTIISPYFIPSASGLDEMALLKKRGVNISVVTNSLASTDEPLVYAAYRRYRPGMLRIGVSIWELGSARSGNSLRLGIFGSPVGRLHTKSVVVDMQTLFIGSMNFDPRSASHNTELAIIIQSPELARQQLKLIAALKEQGAYRLRTSPDGHSVEWISKEGGKETILRSDPDTSFWDRTLPTLLLPLVPEGWL